MIALEIQINLAVSYVILDEIILGVSQSYEAHEGCSTELCSH